LEIIHNLSNGTSDPDFHFATFLKSNVRKTARLKDKITIAQEETIPNIIMEWCYVGATENAGVENAIRAKLQGWKMQEWKMRE